MPRKRKYPNHGSVRRFKKRYPKPQKTLFPSKTVINMKMNYIDNSTLNPGTGQAKGLVVSANGAYDPLPNILGNRQPRGFDQMMQMFNHYIVLGSKITATFTNGQATGAVCGIVLKDQNTVYTSISEYTESQTIVKRNLPGGGGSGVSYVSRTLSMKVNPTKWLGRSNPFADPELKGNVASNPTEQCYYLPFVYPADGASDISVVLIDMTVEYVIAFIEPKEPPAS